MYKAILFDLDGTLYQGAEWIAGALETVQWLVAEGYAVRLITNTSIKNRRQLLERFANTPLAIEQNWLFTPATAAAFWLEQYVPQHRVFPLIHPDLREDLLTLPFVDDPLQADFVLVGDMAEHWSIEVLHQGLRALLNGAQLLAIHRNRHWLAPDGLRLDAGAFVAALEYGANVECQVLFGKPAPAYFQAVLAELGVTPSEALMVGDDVLADVQGAMTQGLNALLVQTGKFKTRDLATLPANAYTLPSVAYLPDFLKG